MFRKLSIMISASVLLACNDNGGQPAEGAVAADTAAAASSVAASGSYVAPASLEGYLDKKEDIWICTDKQYEASAFSNRQSAYASLSRMDADRNTLGIGLINRKGEVVVGPIYDNIEVGFSYGLCQVGKGKLTGLVDTTGKEIVAPVYDMIAQVEDSMMLVEKAGKFGLINLKGEVVIPVLYNALRSAGEGMVSYMTEPQRWGYLNLKNEVVVEPQFTSTARFVKGKVVLQKPDASEYIVYKNGTIEKK